LFDSSTSGTSELEEGEKRISNIQHSTNNVQGKKKVKRTGGKKWENSGGIEKLVSCFASRCGATRKINDKSRVL
jgi:hypothetical protein